MPDQAGDAGMGAQCVDEGLQQALHLRMPGAAVGLRQADTGQQVFGHAVDEGVLIDEVPVERHRGDLVILGKTADGDGFQSAAVEFPTYTKALDYELQLAFVINKPLYNAAPDEAERAIAAFVIMCDFSARLSGGSGMEISRWLQHGDVLKLDLPGVGRIEHLIK